MSGGKTEPLALGVGELGRVSPPGSRRRHGAGGVRDLRDRAGGELRGVDDPAGYCGDVLARLVALHLAACRKAKLPPDVLGPRLLALELASFLVEIEVVDRLVREAHQTAIGLLWQRFIGLLVNLMLP